METDLEAILSDGTKVQCEVGLDERDQPRMLLWWHLDEKLCNLHDAARAADETAAILREHRSDCSSCNLHRDSRGMYFRVLLRGTVTQEDLDWVLELLRRQTERVLEDGRKARQEAEQVEQERQRVCDANMAAARAVWARLGSGVGVAAPERRS